jgi:hypothetical protein
MRDLLWAIELSGQRNNRGRWAQVYRDLPL